MWIRLLFGLALGSLIAMIARRVAVLDRSGAITAALLGAILFGMGGFDWAILLLIFFVSSSVLSHAYSKQKAGLSDKFSKGGQRDWAQVLANGGLGVLLATFHAIYPGLLFPWVAFAAAIATVTADTWATELGVLSPHPPRLITNGKIVERGTSGGISFLGSLASVSGAGLIAVSAAFLSPSINYLVFIVAIMLGGLAGSFFDSLLGATLQAIYYCPTCSKSTERFPLHTCGTSVYRIRGWRWINNDAVNFISSIAGAVVALVIFSLG